MMFKVTHKEAPEYLQYTIETHDAGYNFRKQNKLPSIRCRTATHQKSFFPKTINDWNNLSQNVRTAKDLETFKKEISHNSHAKKVPQWFYSGKRYPSLIHSRLRMLCSLLKDHLYSHIHVIDSPQCPCGFPRETTKHYLLDCPLFFNERQTMIAKLNNLNFKPTLNNLLYGYNEYNLKTNSEAFALIQNFIEETGRFND